ncbi:hypothetical protein HJB53_30335 [Rhizobium lentis]|uniref:hypothetical protein n=1 Tax=Rhizobium lentis TaxID=1138194 RepID=UPI001C82DD26|nr:hypothetical protein [Rhizobium lentis]MBX5130791.1 hypothetical protein [Rhizobium lentis]
MRSFWVLVGLGLLGSIAYGYLDAYQASQVDKPNVTVAVTYDGWLFYDTMDYMQPYKPDQLFLDVRWQQPAGKKIASIRLAGDIMDKGQKVASFDAPCSRAGTQWLANTDRFRNPMTGQPDLECFIKLQAFMPSDFVRHAADDAVVESTAKLRRLRQMEIVFRTKEVRAVRPPLRYITWINEQVATITSWIQYPFERG